MRARLVAAFAAVYIVWGSTYLAIHFAVETLPPLLMAGTRFVISGAILLAWGRWHGRGIAPTKTDWRTGLISGALMLLGGNGAVVWAEQRVPSGIAALLVAAVPLWMVLLDWLRPGGRRPANLVFLGLVLGLVGLGLLVGPDALRGGAPGGLSGGTPGGLHGSGAIDAIGAAVLVVGSLSWALGSLYMQHAPKPSSGAIGSGTEMVAGGACLLVVALATGELSALDLAHVSGRSLLGFLYLVTFGSLVGFTAYLYMLAHTTAARAATYAYVNPVVAVLLGWWLAGEPVTTRTLGAAAVILAGVAIITVTRDRPISEPVRRRAAA